MGKVYINPPTLPASIRGDGRYVMTLLKDFVDTVSEQVNYINGYTPATSDYSIPVPKYFYLTFSRAGFEFSWSPVDVDNFDHYELRLNKSVGSAIGLLSSTTSVKDSPKLLNRTGIVYLYVVLKDESFSNPCTINYSKAVPAAPNKIAVSKTDEGTLVFFDAVPSDCIGAVVYINGVKYETLESPFLYSGGAVVSDVLIAYYDSFGSGDIVDAYFDPPLVSGFMVERNDCYLHFYWDNSALYNAKYVIKRGSDLNWDTAELVCEVYTNTYNCIFPNDGSYYFMIKVYDEHGNASDDASYVSLETVPDIYRNVIVENNQAPSFNGVSHGFVYDDENDSIVLPAGVERGSYYFNSVLPQEYRARNWIDANVFSFSSSDMIWDEADFAWESQRGDYTWAGLPISVSPKVKTEIASYIGSEPNCVDMIGFDNSTTSLNGVVPDSSSINYKPSFFTNGAVITGLDYLTYSLSIPANFSICFCANVNDISSGIICGFYGLAGNISLSYSSKCKSFVLSGSSCDTVRVVVDYSLNDVLFFGICQFNNSIKLFIKSASGSSGFSFGSAETIAYSKFIVGNKYEVI